MKGKEDKLKQTDKDKAKNPLQVLESEFNKRITGLEGRISQIENTLENRSVRSQNELNHFMEVKEKERKLEFYFQHSKKVLKGKVQWLDGYNICIDEEKEGEIIIPKHAILYHKIVVVNKVKTD